MNLITVPKLLITIAALSSSWLALSQNQQDENLSPENIPYGLYYQNGPGANNSLNWDYPFGSKITMNAGSYRNFELLTTNYWNIYC